MFAISSAIPPGHELLGVRHAASGSAATNPGGTIKLHLNNISGRAWTARGREEEKGERHRRDEIRASCIVTEKAWVGTGGGEEIEARGPDGGRDRVNNNPSRKVGVSGDPVWISSYRPNSSAALWRSLNTEIPAGARPATGGRLDRGREAKPREGCRTDTACGLNLGLRHQYRHKHLDRPPMTPRRSLVCGHTI